MKKILIVCLALLSYASSSAALINAEVAIPDPAFRNELITRLGARCFVDQNGVLMLDTEEASLILGIPNQAGNYLWSDWAATFAFKKDYGITDISGVEYFPNVVVFYFKDNNIETVSALPSTTRIEFINCNVKQIVGPVNTKILILENNDLQELPELTDRLEILSIEGNPKLHCLPTLPESLKTLTLDKESISCLRNKPQGLAIFDNIVGVKTDLTSQIRVCDDVVSCNSTSKITGKLYFDADGSGSFSSGDKGIENWKVQITSSSNNLIRYTDSEGDVNFVPEPGTYTVNVLGLPDNFIVTPATTTVTIAENQTIHHDFIVTEKNVISDVSISMVQGNPARPGFVHAYEINYKNNGTEANSTLSFAIPANFTVNIGTTEGYVLNATTKSLEWNLGKLTPFKNGKLFIYGTTDADASLLGTNMVATASIAISNGTDVNLADNKSVVSETIVGSYDPNDISARATMTPTELVAGEYIQYRIRFQNTGTYYAENVKVTDVLSQNLDVSSFELITTSHDCETTILDNKLIFKFNQIMLPAKQDDEEGSNGYIMFRIKPVSTLVVGNEVANFANIFFDFNEAIATNIAITTIETPAPPADIAGAECAKTNTTEIYTLGSQHTVNATNLNWFANGNIQNLSVISGTTSASAFFPEYFTGGEVCVGVNYSAAPWYQQFCMAVENCGNSVVPQETILFRVAPNPSTYKFTITSTTAIQYFLVQRNNSQGWNSISGIAANQSLSIAETWPAGTYVIVGYTQSGQSQSEVLIKQ